MNTKKKIRIAAVGDIHVKEHMEGFYKEYFQDISQKADILLLCGDLTDLGSPTEATYLANDLKYSTIPVVGVLGNHDHQSDQADEVKRILMQNDHVTILGREPVEILGVGISGVKGYIGGFDRYSLGSFGERGIKDIIKERDHEAFTLENQMKAVTAEKRVVIMHYAPIRATVADEPADIMAFLGSTRYEQVIDQYGADVVFHGHANAGPHSGKTSKGIQVFNVALPLLEKISPEKKYGYVEL